jgi:translocation and assembly module TamB
LDDPRLEFTAQIPRLQIQNQTVSGVTLQARIANQVATVALDSLSQTLGTFVRGHGRINLTGNYDADVVFDTSAISLHPLIALYLPARTADITGQTEIHAAVKGPLKDKTRLDAQITIPVFSLSYRNRLQLAAAEPIRVDYRRGVLTLQKTTFRGNGTDLQVQGVIPADPAAPMSIVALGTVDLVLVQMLDPDITSSGQLQFNIGGAGRRADPNFQGQIKVVDAAISGDNLPVSLQSGNGVLKLTNRQLEIETFQGKVSGGLFTATGGLTYRPSLQFNLVLSGTDIRTMYPQGVREGMEANLTLTGSPQSAVLRGQIRLTELSFSPAFDIDEVLATLTGTQSRTTPPGAIARKINLDLQLVSTDDLNLASSKLSLQGSTNLRIRGTLAGPSVIGRVNITGGDLVFRGNRYLLEPGTVDFADPYRIEPRVNVGASAKVQDYEIRLLFRGTIDRLRTTYTSDPPLPPSDIINLLVFGATAVPTEVTSTFGNLGAQSLIASSVSRQVTSRVEQIAGISYLSVDPVLGGNQDLGARITVQQRVTGNLFVTFATDAATTQRQVLKLQYQATPRIGISGVRDQNGGFAFDVSIKKTW